MDNPPVDSPRLPTAVRETLPLQQQLLIWAPVALGMAVMFVPTLRDLFTGVWSQDEQGHGPIILAISIWLFYRKWRVAMVDTPLRPARLAGGLSLVLGLLSFMVGRSQAIVQMEAGAVIPVLVGIILIFRGWQALKAFWFPLFFMVFMVPLPGIFVQALTIPLKTAVSIVVENMLFWLGYPIARTGVILQVGQYQMLVADACAGLHTLFTLEAIGLLYMNLVGHESVRRNLFLAVLIVPISFTANVIRVTVLVLITYYFGDEAGQGFLHGFAGMTLFLSALVLIIAVDTALGKLIDKSPKAAHA